MSSVEEVPEKSLEVPKIDSSKINDVFKELVKSFRMTGRVTPLWICGRSANFGFRPSLAVKFLPNITKAWISDLEKGMVMLVPLIFYTCDANNIENLEEQGNKEFDPNFLVYNHYNVLVSYLTADGVIKLERYEPSSVRAQGNLHEVLGNLFVGLLKTYTKRPVEFELVAPKGLQAVYKDRRLCGHHIIYWTIYRLKYGLKASVNMITDPMTSPRFERFCGCMSESTVGKCLESTD